MRLAENTYNGFPHNQKSVNIYTHSSLTSDELESIETAHYLLLLIYKFSILISILENITIKYSAVNIINTNIIFSLSYYFFE